VGVQVCAANSKSQLLCSDPGNKCHACRFHYMHAMIVSTHLVAAEFQLQLLQAVCGHAGFISASEQPLCRSTYTQQSESTRNNSL
jgi:hypothetical protein